MPETAPARHPDLDRRLVEVVRPVLDGTHALTVRAVSGQERLALVPVAGRSVRVLSRPLSCDIAAYIGEGFADTASTPVSGDGQAGPAPETPRPAESAGPKMPRPKTMAAVFAAVEGGARTVPEVVASAGVSRRTVVRALDVLLAEGRVSRERPATDGRGGSAPFAYAVAGPAPRPSEAEARRAEVLAVLGDEPRTVGEIAGEAGCAYKPAWDALRSLADDGLAVRVETGPRSHAYRAATPSDE